LGIALRQKHELRSTAETGSIRTSAVRLSESAFAVEEDKVIEIDTEPGGGVLGSYFVSCHINDMNGVVVTQCDSRLVGMWLDPERGHRVTLTLSHLWLKPGRYSVDVFLCAAGVIDRWDGAAAFDVLPTLPYPELALGEAIGEGLVLSDFSYEAAATS
jgi:lipopolysaccharide transport system ATP-binding protein